MNSKVEQRPHEELKIFVKTLSGKTFRLDVDSYDPVGKIKKIIQAKTRMLSDKHKLSFNGKALEEWKTLAEYNIENESTLQAVVIANPKIQIYINTSLGKTITLDVDPDDTIKAIKEKIKRKR